MSKEIQYEIVKKLKERCENCNIIINNKEPYTLYRESDIARLLNTKSLRSITNYYNKNEKIKVKILTTQGEQLISHLTYNGLLKLLSNYK